MNKLDIQTNIECAATAAVAAIAWVSIARADPAPPNATYFATCLANSVAAKTFYRDGRYLRFACYGDNAQSFFDALGRRPADVSYEERHDDGVYRFTEKPVKNTNGLDYCRHAASTRQQEYLCVLIYPAGAFMDR